MGRLSGFSALAALVLTGPVAAAQASHPAPVSVAEPHDPMPGPAVDPVARWDTQIAEAARRFGLPPAWIARVMRAESGGRTRLYGRPIVSPKGAMGLMQLMPGTWAEARLALGLGGDPHDPHDNILAGAWYLRRMYDRFGHPGLFAAYNAGPGRYAAYLDGRSRLPAETRAYLARVTGSQVPTPAQRQRQPNELPASGGIFFTLRATHPSTLFAVQRPEPDGGGQAPELSRGERER